MKKTEFDAIENPGHFAFHGQAKTTAPDRAPGDAPADREGLRLRLADLEPGSRVLPTLRSPAACRNPLIADRPVAAKHLT